MLNTEYYKSLYLVFKGFATLSCLETSSMLNTEDFTQRYRPVPHCDSKTHANSWSSIASTSLKVFMHRHL